MTEAAPPYLLNADGKRAYPAEAWEIERARKALVRAVRGHYVSIYCIHGHHRNQGREYCEVCGDPCRCECHL